MDADIFSSLEIDMKLFFVSYPEFCSAETLVLILKKLCQDHTTEVLSFVDVWLSKGFFLTSCLPVLVEPLYQPLQICCQTLV